MRSQALLAGCLLLLVGGAACQGSPCTCSPDGSSGGTWTGRRGCAQHLPGDPGFFCMVIDPAACPSATPSASYPGAAWLDCQPGAGSTASAQASAVVERQPQPGGRKWGPVSGGTATAEAAAAAFSSGGNAAANAQGAAQASGGGWWGQGGSAAANAAASAQTNSGGSADAFASAQSTSNGRGGSTASALGAASASGGSGSANAYASADATSLGCGLAQAVASASASATGVLPAQQQYQRGKPSTLQLSATAVAQAQALAYSLGCMANPGGFGCQLAEAVASAEVGAHKGV